MRYIPFLLLILSSFSACLQAPEKKVLPILGERDISPSGDTLYPQIPDFAFVDQDSQIITNATFRDKIYIVDFFFIHCPSICPIVKKNLLRVHEKYRDDPRIGILSHSIDTKHDTVAALRKYAHKLEANTKQWHFVTGNKDSIYGIADNYYSVNPTEDPDAPGGFNHDGRLILVDKQRHVRSFCDGTIAEEVDRFMQDIDLLLQEQFPKQ